MSTNTNTTFFIGLKSFLIFFLAFLTIFVSFFTISFYPTLTLLAWCIINFLLFVFISINNFISLINFEKSLPLSLDVFSVVFLTVPLLVFFTPLKILFLTLKKEAK